MQTNVTVLRALALAALAAAWCAPLRAETTVSYGKITAVKPVTVESTKAQAGGALLGGAIGLISGRGHSGSNQALRAIGGGLGGQQIAKLASSKQAFDYTIVVGGTTSVTVVTDESGMRVGDCVAVERGTYTNLRLAPDAQCAPRLKPAPAPTPSAATREANACIAAKEEVLKAQNDEAFNRAERKVRLLCVD